MNMGCQECKETELEHFIRNIYAIYIQNIVFFQKLPKDSLLIIY